jgi:type I restriction enzyme, S subunit
MKNREKNKLQRSKNTTVGEIPIDWEVKTLGDIGVFKKGKGISKRDLVEDGNKCILYGELYTQYNEAISEVKSKTSVSEVKSIIGQKNDILIPSSGETAYDIARASVLLEDKILIGGDINIFTPNKEVSGQFISYLLNSVRKSDLSKLAQGSSVYHLYTSSLVNFPIMLPSKEEQQMIVEILYTLDKQLNVIREIIEITNQLKEILLTQLLTKGLGHTEFKNTIVGEVPTEWDVKFISEVANTTSGGTPSRKKPEYYLNGTIPWIKTGELKRKYLLDTEEKITEEAIIHSSAKWIEPDSVIVAMYGATIGQSTILKVPATTNQACCAIRTNKEQLSEEYLYYYLKFSADKLIKMGAGGAQPNISQAIIKNFPLKVPPIREQQKIVKILSTIDDQIESYSQEEQKYKVLKKGLMQQLLTGKIRVNV